MSTNIAILYNKTYRHARGSSVFRPSSGGSDDYFYSRGIPISFTIEMRDTGDYGFLMPEEQIIPNAEENLIGVQTVLEGVDKE